MLKILIHGSKGRMGKAVAACAAAEGDVEIVAGVDAGDSLDPGLSQADAVIDFSAHDAVPALAAACAGNGKPLISGTTGLTEEERQAFRDAANRIPIVWASNFSTGVNALFWLVRRAVRVLGEKFDVEIVEMHHRLKKDAPSGTAQTLAEIVAAERRLPLDRAARHGRYGLVGERGAGEIGIHSLRGGDVVGDHTVCFAGPGRHVLDLDPDAAAS